MKKIITSCLLAALFTLPVKAQDILNAVRSGDMEKVKSFLKENPNLIRTKDQYKNSLLRLALLKNDFLLARFLVESGIDVNYGREDTGGNELFSAISVGSLEITKLIFEKGADVNIKNTWGRNPLDAAIFDGHREIAYFLMDKGATLNIQESGVSSLIRASLSGGMERITNQLIKNHKIDFTNTNGLGETIIHAAAQGGEPAFIDLLIKKGLDPNVGNVYGWAPLHYAASAGHQNIIDALLTNKADKNIRTKDGKTPYNIAEEFGRKDLLPYLKVKGFETGIPEFPKIDAKYIDSNLPGKRPQRFALGIISQIHHFEHSMFTFTADMKTACWADWQRNGVSKIFVMEKNNGFWEAPQTVHLHATNPFLTTDGKKIYFTAKRSLPDGTEGRDNDIFFIQRTENGWSERIDLGPNVNTDNDEHQPVVTKNGTLYFAHDGDIYRSKLVRGRYAQKEKLPAPINNDTSQSEPLISPDESYMIYRSLGTGGMMEPNFYFTFRNENDTWTEPVNIAEKVETIGLFPSLTPDNKYLIYFLGGDYNWFDISAVMEDLMKSSDSPALTGLYLGQKPPGTNPQIFAPGIVSRKEYAEHDGDLRVTDESEIYWVDAGFIEEQKKESAAAIIEKTIEISGIESAINKFAEMKSSDGEKYIFDEKEFDRLGLQLMIRGKVIEALEIYRMNVELFPDSANAWFNLAKGYVNKLEKKNAEDCFKRAMELNPDDWRPKAELGWIDFRIENAKLETRVLSRFDPGKTTGLTGLYLGQKPPGLKPEKFAPGIISTYGARELSCTFSSDGKEFYFMRSGVGIMVARLQKDGWRAPEKTDIDGGEMYIWPKNGKMYLNVTARKPDDPDGDSVFGIGSIERTETGWSKPTFLVPGMFVTLANDGTLYTTDIQKGGLARFPLIDGKYSSSKAVVPESGFNAEDAHPCIAPDKSFLVFDVQRSGRQPLVALYVIFRKDDGSWSKAIEFGEKINMPGSNSCPMLSPDGKYLFFSSHNDIYWVSSEVIKKLKQGNETFIELRDGKIF